MGRPGRQQDKDAECSERRRTSVPSYKGLCDGYTGVQVALLGANQHSTWPVPRFVSSYLSREHSVASGFSGDLLLASTERTQGRHLDSLTQAS